MPKIGHIVFGIGILFILINLFSGSPPVESTLSAKKKGFHLRASIESNNLIGKGMGGEASKSNMNIPSIMYGTAWKKVINILGEVVLRTTKPLVY